MKIAIRADGGELIGMGHIMRTLVLAKELTKYAEIYYICKESKENPNRYKMGIEKVIAEGFQVKLIDENNVRNEIWKFKADCILTDSYDVDKEYYKTIKNNFKISGCIDDNNLCSYYDVDFLLNQNIFASDMKYNVNDNTVLMLGLDYVMLRDEFRQFVKRDVSDNVENIMITVGSTDAHNVTEKIIGQLKGYRLDVIVGAGFIHAKSLRKLGSDRITLHFNADMKARMLECDLAVATCGTTIYELASCSTPTVGMVTVDNQRLTAKYLKDAEMIVYSEIDNVGGKVGGITKDKRENLIRKMQNSVDGKGFERIVKNILALMG